MSHNIMSSSTATPDSAGNDEELAIMSLLQIRKAPASSSDPSKDKNEPKERPAKKQKVKGKERGSKGRNASGVSQKLLEQKNLFTNAVKSEEERHTTSHGAESSKKQTETRTYAVSGQFDDAPDEAVSDARGLERELAARSLDKSPLEKELALRALENASFAGYPYNRLAAASAAPMGMGHPLFPTPGLFASNFLQQQRDRQIQMENAMLRAQLAAVEQQRLNRLALLQSSHQALNPSSSFTTPLHGASAAGDCWLARREEQLAQAAPSAASATAGVPSKSDAPGIVVDKVKSAMLPTNEARKPENQRLCTRTKFRYEHYTPPQSWSELTDVPKIPPVPADDDMKNPIEVAGENDVLLGRGGATNMHPGNISFRNLVQRYRSAYCTVPKGDKGALARFLCNYVRAKKGRFLRQDPTDKKWYEVGDEKAIGKCGQALREGSAEYMKSGKNATANQQQKCGMPIRMGMFTGETAQSR